MKDNERNLCQDFTDSDLKVHALHYANELLVRCKLACRNNAKKMLGKRVMTSTLVDKGTDHDKPHFDFFFTTISTSKKLLFFHSAS